MIDLLKRNPQRIFYFLLALYVSAGLNNLPILPIAWTDEVMNLDPALQWHKQGKYVGLLWPNAGSDKIFLSYPPLIQWFHLCALYFIPFEIYWVRLPVFLLHIGTIILLYQAIRKFTPGNTWLAVALGLLFAFDKVVFEISRSMRVETLESFLVVLLFWLHVNKGSLKIKGLLLGLLLISHLKMWPFVLLWVLLEWIWTPKLREKMWMTLIVILPSLLFLFFIQFDISEWYTQMFSQAVKHQAPELWTAKVYGYFIQRFRYVYLEQPWVFLLHAWMLVSAIMQIIKSKGKSYVSILYLGTTIVWLGILAPHYRYWPPLLACGILVLAADPYVAALFKKPTIQKLFIFFIPLLIFGFVARHAIAYYQKDERSTALVHKWINRELDFKDKSLIIGNAAAFYLSQQKNLDYGMEMYPQNLHFNHYQNVYYLTTDSQNLKRISMYSMGHKELPIWMQSFGKGQTYYGLKLYKIETEIEWKKITKPFENDYN